VTGIVASWRRHIELCQARAWHGYKHPGQSGEQAKVQRQGAGAPKDRQGAGAPKDRQGAGAPKDRQDRVPAVALPDASGYDQPSEPPTGIQPGILAVLFRVVATWRGGFGFSPDCLVQTPVPAVPGQGANALARDRAHLPRGDPRKGDHPRCSARCSGGIPSRGARIVSATVPVL
jgi:hypothetical protein